MVCLCQCWKISSRKQGLEDGGQRAVHITKTKRPNYSFSAWKRTNAMHFESNGSVWIKKSQINGHEILFPIVSFLKRVDSSMD